MRDFLARWPILLLAAITFALLSQPPQVHEFYRDGAQDAILTWITSGQVFRITLLGAAFASALFLSWWLWLGARHPGMALDDRPNALSAILCAIAPLAGLAVGLWEALPPEIEITPQLLQAEANAWAKHDPDASAEDFVAFAHSFLLKLSGFRDVLQNALIATLAVAVAVLLLFAVKARSFASLRRRNAPLSWAATLAWLALFFGTAYFVSREPALPARYATPFTLLALLIAVAVVVAIRLTELSRLIGFPVLGAVMAAVVALTALDLTALHQIRGAHPAKTADALPTTPPQLAAEFDRWLRSRGEDGEQAAESQSQDQDAPKDVFIVAAQGGGVYAAYHAAKFLSESVEECPLFGRRLFAISAVSGGSVGAAAFAALIDDAARSTAVYAKADPGCDAVFQKEPKAFLSNRANEIFVQDFWTPLQASIMFPDLVQRILPVDVPSFDRAQALEKAFEAHSLRGLLPPDDNLLAKPFLGAWNPSKAPMTPALILNATDVGTGQRRAFSPFAFCGSQLEFFPVWKDSPAGQLAATPLSAASVASARFPWVTPAGAFETLHRARCVDDVATLAPHRRFPRRRVVDGGYFENSGVATALDLIDAIERAVEARARGKVRLHLIVLTSQGFEPQKFFGFHDQLSPIRALLNTQTSRADFEIRRAEQIFTQPRRAAPAASDRYFQHGMLLKFPLKGEGFQLPLGWKLSLFNRMLINLQNGSEEFCSDESLKAWRSAPDLGLDGGCVKRLVFQCLRGQGDCTGKG